MIVCQLITGNMSMLDLAEISDRISPNGQLLINLGTPIVQKLVRAECVRQRNEVAIKLGIIFSSLLSFSSLSLSLLPSSAKSPRESCRRVLKFCMGS
jgi:hypothetical protein